MANWLQNVGKTVGGIAEKAAPFVGMIPGVGTLAGGAIGGLGALMHGDGLSGALQYGTEGALGGMAGGNGFMGKIGSALGNTFMPNGQPDLAKIASAVGTGMNLIGSAKQRNSATNYNNAQIDQRNNLMNQVTGPQNYGLPDISDNVKAAAAPVGGPKITPKNPALTSSVLAAPNLN